MMMLFRVPTLVVKLSDKVNQFHSTRQTCKLKMLHRGGRAIKTCFLHTHACTQTQLWPVMKISSDNIIAAQHLITVFAYSREKLQTEMCVHLRAFMCVCVLTGAHSSRSRRELRNHALFITVTADRKGPWLLTEHRVCDSCESVCDKERETLNHVTSCGAALSENSNTRFIGACVRIFSVYTCVYGWTRCTSCTNWHLRSP